MVNQKEHMTYARAGVNIDDKSAAIGALVDQLRFRRYGKVRMIDLPGGFTGLVDMGDVALTLCTDGVGTKLLIAKALDKWDTVGIDCVAMNVNDTICVGAEPISFVDYIAVDEPNERITSQIGIGLNKGCEMSNCDLVGGEIAVLPEIMREIDLSGSCLGMVPKDKMINGSKIQVGDAVIGLASSGIHSNGLTLARKILQESEIDLDEKFPKLGRTIGMELLTPTEIYVKRVLKIIEKYNIKGLVDVTGGGLRNFLRLRKDVRITFEDPLPVPPIFDILAGYGNVEPRELYQTFNMGMGFGMVCSSSDAKGIVSLYGSGAKIVGHVTEGTGVDLGPLNIMYDKY